MKRLFDLSFAIFLLACLLPLIFISMLAIMISIGRPIFFCQWRPGLYGKPFKLIKFRTMTNQFSANGQLLPDADRLTPVGRLLRSLSMDELPELWNVIKGDMSLVGPRPLLMEYLSLYNTHQARRHDVLPGITGWAQVNGRNALSWEEKFELDVWYVANRSLWLDIKILIMTLRIVLMRKGISSAGHATVENFQRFK
jgi:lipopolysaccharide/colanic/teichoic acid biosynthesis glycosyltransferase